MRGVEGGMNRYYRFLIFMTWQAIFFAGLWQWLKWVIKYMRWLGVI